ncbi:hypothetical protein Bhyg_15849, partial [Pseudolycoriella hygida]
MMNVNEFLCDNKDGFMGTAELIQSGRKSRLSRDFSSQHLDKSVKLSDDTIREYGQLLQMDTKNFSDQQKVLLEKIVERVARLGGANLKVDAANVTDINENEGRGNKNRLKKNSHSKNQSAPTKAAIKHDQHDGNGKLTVKHNIPSKANITEVMFGNISTSSIVDSLSADNAREDIQLKKRPVGPASIDKTKIK